MIRHYTSPSAGDPLPALTRTCRQLRAEVLPMAFTLRRFFLLLRVGEDSDPCVAHRAAKFLAVIGPEAMQLLGDQTELVVSGSWYVRGRVKPEPTLEWLHSIGKRRDVAWDVRLI